MTELNFQLPEASIAVEATEAQRLFEELDRLGARPTAQDYARMARRVGTAAHERSVHAVELLDVAENEKVLRALEHLAVRDELSTGLVSLWRVSRATCGRFPSLTDSSSLISMAAKNVVT
jgi:hypothetical protein